MLTRGADVFIENKCTKWLSDDQENAALRKEDIEWGQSHWEKDPHEMNNIYGHTDYTNIIKHLKKELKNLQ